MNSRADVILKVANFTQKILFDWELCGQISDGYWENTRPFNHWRVWCSAEIVVADNPKEIGRNFWPEKQNYNFAAPELLEVVGERMLKYAKLALALKDEEGFNKFFQPVINSKYEPRSIEYFIDENFNISAPNHEGEYWDGMRQAFGQLDLEWLSNQLKARDYKMADLKEDLNQLKEAIKIRI